MKNNKISPGEGRVQEQGGLSSNITFCGRDSFQCNQTGCTVISGDSLMKMKPAGWKWWWHEWRRVLLASHSQVVTPNTQCDDSQSSWGRPGDFSRIESKHNNILSTNTLEESVQPWSEMAMTHMWLYKLWIAGRRCWEKPVISAWLCDDVCCDTGLARCSWWGFDN